MRVKLYFSAIDRILKRKVSLFERFSYVAFLFLSSVYLVAGGGGFV